MPKCNHSHTHIGGCGLADYDDPFPPGFDYLRDNPNYLGGADAHTDYCPYVVATEGGDCRNSDLSVLCAQNYGEKRCPNCRCIEGVVAPTGYLPKQFAGCFEIVCTTTHILVTVGGNEI
jgi:hypothetical protein